MNMNNKTLAFLIMAGMVLSLFSTMINLNSINKNDDNIDPTGYVTEGTINYSIASHLEIDLINASIDFGSGYVNNSAGLNCTLDSNESSHGNDCVDFNSGTGGFVIENTGNTLAAVTIEFNETIADFMNVNSSMYFATVESEVGSCIGTMPSEAFVDGEVINTNPNTICTNMSYAGSDELTINIRLVVDRLVSGQDSHDMGITIGASSAE